MGVPFPGGDVSGGPSVQQAPVCLCCVGCGMSVGIYGISEGLCAGTVLGFGGVVPWGPKPSILSPEP